MLSGPMHGAPSNWDSGQALHPSQPGGPCNEIFSPTAEEIAHARRVVEAFEKSESEGVGALQLDGKFIDYPVVERSRRSFDWRHQSVSPYRFVLRISNSSPACPAGGSEREKDTMILPASSFVWT